MTSRQTYNVGLSYLLNGAKLIRQAAREGAEVDETVKLNADRVLGFASTELPTLEDLVLEHLKDGPLCTTDLARRLAINPNAVVGYLKGVENRGRVTHERMGGRVNAPTIWRRVDE